MKRLLVVRIRQGLALTEALSRCRSLIKQVVLFLLLPVVGGGGGSNSTAPRTSPSSFVVESGGGGGGKTKNSTNCDRVSLSKPIQRVAELLETTGGGKWDDGIDALDADAAAGAAIFDAAAEVSAADADADGGD